MYERCLNEAERILAKEKEIVVPIKKIWQEVCRQGKNQKYELPSLADFTALLEGDKRFEFLPAFQNQEELFEATRNESEGLEDAELESMGFYSGDRVKLKSVELTPERIGSIIRDKVDRTMNALTKAWESRPEGDQETEDQLLEILARTQKLQREVKQTFSEEKMQKLEKTLKAKNKKTTSGSSKTKTADKKKSKPVQKLSGIAAQRTLKKKSSKKAKGSRS
ncbi:MAG: hypothetical protein V1799_19740 [bacterium]